MVDKVKGDEANFKAQSEIQRNEIENLQKQLAEGKLKCVVAKAERDASDYWKNYCEKTVAGLRLSKERCFEKSVECIKNIKTSFADTKEYQEKLKRARCTGNLIDPDESLTVRMNRK